MKALISLSVLASFLGVAVFGFTFMNHSMTHSGQNTCLASVVNGGVCILETAIVSHFEAFRTLLSSNSEFGLSIVAAVSLLLVLSILWFYKPKPIPYLNSYLSKLLFKHRKLKFRDRKITSWISLFELSPSLA